MSYPAAALVALALILAPIGAKAGVITAAYVPGTEDIPLMPGLHSSDESTVIFDKPQGRIIESDAKGPVSRHDVLRFYQNSLPQLGWAPVEAAIGRRYTRDGEDLRLDFAGQDGDLAVAFTVTPQ